MGGLIARWALAQSHPNNPPFPPLKLLVRDAVEMDSPNGGFSIFNFAACGTDIFHLCIEGQQMQPNSSFIKDLAAQNPQGAAGTQWTLMGSDCGNTCANQ